MNTFKASIEHLGSLKSTTASELLGAMADIALVVDNNGVIRDISATNEELVSHSLTRWIGTKWVDTVAPDSIAKVEKMLNTRQAKEGQVKHRQINHLLPDGSNLLISYSAVHLEQPGFQLLVGKDLRAFERMQQKLLDVQQVMERDYDRPRRFEIRYRVLFQTAPEAIVIANTADQKIVEANPLACELVKTSESKIKAKKLFQIFDKSNLPVLEDALFKVEHSQEPVEISLKTGREEDNFVATLSSFKVNKVPHILMRITAAPTDDQAKLSSPAEPISQSNSLARILDNIPDALVITDDEGMILTTNSEFLDLIQLASPELAQNEPLSRWLGYGQYDFPVIMKSLDNNQAVRLYSTQIKCEYGAPVEVEISALAFEDGGHKCVAFSIRNVSRRLAAANEAELANTPRDRDGVAELVGRVPLKELVRESTELVEQLCIEAALRKTGNNRASAAEMLGVSRQSLYVKLRRYSLDTSDGRYISEDDMPAK